MNVTLDVFSGRPNPSWDLTPQQTGELAKRLTNLAPATRPPSAGSLGYRGFALTDVGKSTGFAHMRVFHGLIDITENGRTTYFDDTSGIENWLIGLARQRGYGALLDQLGGNGAR